MATPTEAPQRATTPKARKTATVYTADHITPALFKQALGYPRGIGDGSPAEKELAKLVRHFDRLVEQDPYLSRKKAETGLLVSSGLILKDPDLTMSAIHRVMMHGIITGYTLGHIAPGNTLTLDAKGEDETEREEDEGSETTH